MNDIRLDSEKPSAGPSRFFIYERINQ